MRCSQACVTLGVPTFWYPSRRARMTPTGCGRHGRLHIFSRSASNAVALQNHPPMRMYSTILCKTTNQRRTGSIQRTGLTRSAGKPDSQRRFTISCVAVLVTDRCWCRLPTAPFAGGVDCAAEVGAWCDSAWAVVLRSTAPGNSGTLAQAPGSRPGHWF